MTGDRMEEEVFSSCAPIPKWASRLTPASKTTGPMPSRPRTAVLWASARAALRPAQATSHRAPALDPSLAKQQHAPRQSEECAPPRRQAVTACFQSARGPACAAPLQHRDRYPIGGVLVLFFSLIILCAGDAACRPEADSKCCVNSPVLQDANLGSSGARRSVEFEYIEGDSGSLEEASESEVGDETCH